MIEFPNTKLSGAPTYPQWAESTDRRRTRKHKEMIEAGIHPLTKLKIIEGKTCGECRHVLRNYSHARYHKCSKASITHGPGTDLRTSWPACELFEEKS